VEVRKDRDIVKERERERERKGYNKMFIIYSDVTSGLL
jgi:hypothetical protein